MKTDFEFYDENKVLTKADLVLSFNYNNKDYVIYELKDNPNSDSDILHVREYEEIDGVPNLYKVDDTTLEEIKNIISSLYNEI